MRDNQNYIVTYTGRKFWPMDPRAEDINPVDIAHALSLQCRFGGHAKHFYSVAHHSLLVAYHAAPEDKLWALLHDAAEAYLVDLPRPIKHQSSMTAYRDAEAAIMRAVCDAFGLPHKQPASVTEADHRMLVTEARKLMNWGEDIFCDWAYLGEPYTDETAGWIQPTPPPMTEMVFIQALKTELSRLATPVRLYDAA